MSSIILQSLSTMNSFDAIKPKLWNKKIFYHWVPFLLPLSVFMTKEGYCTIFLLISLWKFVNQII